jgi:cytoskeleton protein RodZ
MSDPTPPPTAAPDQSRSSPGARLRAARERRGLTLAEAADALRLDTAHVEALERDDYSPFGVPVFVKGHLRAYARLTGEPVDDLLLAYHQLVGVHAVAPLVGQPTIVQTTTTRPARAFSPSLVLVGLFVAGAAATWWWYEQPVESPRSIRSLDSTSGALAAASLDSSTGAAASDSDGSVAPAMADAIDSESQSVAAGATTGTSGSGTTADVGAAGGPASAPDSAPAPASVTTDGTPTAPPGGAAAATTGFDATAPVALAPGEHLLSVGFRGDSWADIRDANGQRLYYGLGLAGSRHTVRGNPPFEVLLGRYVDVSLELDGEPRAVPQDAIRGDTAHFNVTP